MKKHTFLNSQTKNNYKVPVLENKIHQAIAAYLRLVIKRPSRWHTVEVSNQASGKAAMFRQIALKKRGVITGWPDIEIIVVSQNNVMMIFLEVKIPGGKLTEKQEALHQELREDGHNVHVVHSVDEVETVLKTLEVI